MARPTVTWKYCTGTTSGEFSAIGSGALSYGSVQAGYWSAVKCVKANFSSFASDLRFWLNDPSAVNAGTNVDVSSVSGSSGWKHTYLISNTFVNPNDAVFSSTVKAGDAAINVSPLNALAKPKFYQMPASEVEALGDNANGNLTSTGNHWYTPVIGSTEPLAGGDTDYIYIACRPALDAADGQTTGWGCRISFMYATS